MRTKLALVGGLFLLLSGMAAAQPTLRPPVNLKIGTWNTMLQPWFTNEADVVTTIADSKFDVLVLQSVWTDDAASRILADPAVSRRYGYHYYATVAQDPAGADLTDPTMNYLVQAYVGCLIDYDVNTTQLLQLVPAMPIDCLTLRIGMGIHNYNPFNQLAAACLDNAMQFLPRDEALKAVEICGATQGVKYGHLGRPGLLVLSRSPLSNIQEVPYETAGIRRAAIYATISRVRFAFAHFPTNDLEDIDPSLSVLQYGNSASNMAQGAIDAGADLVVGTVNSGLDYQPAAHELLLSNGFSALFAEPTYCPAATHANLAQCQGQTPRGVDNIYVKEGLGACRTETFALQPISDHIGLSAACLLGK